MSEGKLFGTTEGSIGVTICNESTPDNAHTIIAEINGDEDVVVLNKGKFVHFMRDSAQIRVIAIEDV